MVVSLLVKIGFGILLDFQDEGGGGEWEILGKEWEGFVQFAGAVEDLFDVAGDGGEAVLEDVRVPG